MKPDILAISILLILILEYFYVHKVLPSWAIKNASRRVTKNILHILIFVVMILYIKYEIIKEADDEEEIIKKTMIFTFVVYFIMNVVLFLFEPRWGPLNIIIDMIYGHLIMLLIAYSLSP